jgi:hypothetical protein
MHLSNTARRLALVASLLTALQSLNAQSNSTNLINTGTLTSSSDLWIKGNTASFGTNTSATLTPGFDVDYIDGSIATINFSATRAGADWLFSKSISSPQFRISSNNELYVYESASTSPQSGYLVIGSHSIGKVLAVNPDLRISAQDGYSYYNTQNELIYPSSGSLYLTGGTSDENNGGNVILSGGGSTYGQGGVANVQGGDGGSYGDAGNVNIRGGRSPYWGVGGTVLITGGIGNYDQTTSPVLLNPAAGNVGIGTADPSTKLEVIGDIKFSGNLITPNGTFVANSTNGNVGIGVSDPSIRLTINQDTTGPIFEMRPGDDLARRGFGYDMSGAPYELSNYFPTGYSGEGRMSWGTYDGTNYSEQMALTANGELIGSSGAWAINADRIFHANLNLYSGSGVALITNVGASAGFVMNTTNQTIGGAFGTGGNLSLVGGYPDAASDWGGYIFLGGPARGDSAINQVRIGANDTPYLTIDGNTGNVGIGTSNPGDLLHIAGGNILLENNQYLRSTRTTSEPHQIIGLDENDDLTLNRGSLTIFGDSKLPSGLIAFIGSGKWLDIRNSTNVSKFYIAESSGNIGIGTTNPSAKLEVVGNAKITGALQTTGTLTAPSITLPDGSVLNTARNVSLQNPTTGANIATVNTSGQLTLSNTLASSSATTGALQTPGGIGVGGTSFFGDGLRVNGGFTGPGFSLGVVINAGNQTPGTSSTTAIEGIYAGVTTANGTYTTADVRLLNLGANITKGSGHTITNATGIVVPNISAGVNNTNLLLGTGSTPAGNFSLYNASTYANYFAGNVGIKTVPTADAVAVSGDIEVSGKVKNSTNNLVLSSNGTVELHSYGGAVFTARNTGATSLVPFAVTPTAQNNTAPWWRAEQVVPTFSGTNTGTLTLGYYAPTLSSFTNSGTVRAIYADTTGISGNAYSGIFMGGNVGIGTTTPTERLEVVGNLKLSGNLITANGTLTLPTNTSGTLVTTVGNQTITGTTTFNGTTQITGTNTKLLVGDTLATSNNWNGSIVAGDTGRSKVTVGNLGSTISGPTIAGHNSSMTGWADLNLAATNLIFRTGGETERARITFDGKVGIGVTSPSAKLQITSTGMEGDRGLRIVSANTTTDSYAEAQFSAPGREYRIGTGGNATTLGLANKFYLWDIQANAPRLVVDTNGSLGLGTVTPQAKLDVNDGRIRVSSTSGGTTKYGEFFMNGNIPTIYSNDPSGFTPVVINANGSPFQFIANPFGSDSLSGIEGGSATRDFALINSSTTRGISFHTAGSFTPKVYIKSDGNVGIGTTTPTERLEVVGNFKLSGNLITANGTLTLPTNSSGTLVTTNGTQTITGNTTVSGVATLGGTTASTQLRVDTSGNVGIGTLSPTAKLDVSGGINFASGNVIGATNLNITTDLNQAYYFGLSRANVISRFNGVKVYNIANAIGLPGSRVGIFTDNTGYSPSTEWFTVNELGNVGVGITAPTSKLHVWGPAKVDAGSLTVNGGWGGTGDIYQNTGQGGTVGHYLYRDGAAAASGWTSFGMRYTDTWNTAPADIRLSLVADGAERLSVRTGGNVGIGTTTPNAKLEVRDGRIRASSSSTTALGELYVSGTGIVLESNHSSGGGIGLNATGTMYTFSANEFGHTAFSGIRSTSSTKNFAIVNASPTAGLGLHTAGNISPSLFVSSAGNVGIGSGTNNPTEKLQVTGNVSVSGTLTVAGNAVATVNQLTGYATTASLAPYQLSAGNGSALTNLNASALASGTVDVARLPSTVTQLGNSIDLNTTEVAGSLPWAKINATPTTTTGYGITDAVTKDTSGNVAISGNTTLQGIVVAQNDIKVRNRKVIRINAAGDIPMLGYAAPGDEPELP